MTDHPAIPTGALAEPTSRRLLRPSHLWMAILLLSAWLISGFYIVRGNEQAVVRRFGALVRNAGGGVEIQSSGLRWDLPWPLSRIDRVNTHEVRTLTIGRPEFGPELEQDSATGFLANVDPEHQSQFLTGDRNILNLQVTVHYHVGDIDRFLFGESDPHARLKSLVESLVTDTVSNSDVDFVYVNGRHQLRGVLVDRLATALPGAPLGLVVDDVTVGAVYPPIQAKSEFLDVMNARAERKTHINNAQAYQVKRANESQAQAKRTQLEAAAYGSRTIAAAQGEAARFGQLVTQIQHEAKSGQQDYAGARRLAMKRMYLDTMRSIFARVAAKIVLDSGKPVDLTILRQSGK
ncbi:MAG: hypothetical protein CMJ68_15845 [Planctomycetaceae bacterium]|nr:hypothetical protein [Planctomycetaceae bacterium]